MKAVQHRSRYRRKPKGLFGLRDRNRRRELLRKMRKTFSIEIVNVEKRANGGIVPIFIVLKRCFVYIFLGCFVESDQLFKVQFPFIGIFRLIEFHQYSKEGCLGPGKGEQTDKPFNKGIRHSFSL
jgi:hypothetical protein